MTELAGVDTTPPTTALVVTGLGSVGFIAGVVAVLVGSVPGLTLPIVEQLLVAVVFPMLVGIGARAW